MLSGMANTAIVAGVGVVVIILASTLGWIAYPNIVVSQAIIKPENNLVYDAWVIPPVPIFMQFYLFDCINCNNINFPTTPDIKPILVQKGPFTYNETRQKFNVTLENGQLTYQEQINYTYAPTEGELPLTTTVTQPNPVYFTILSLIDDADIPDLQKTTISNLMHNRLASINEGPFMTHTADEMLLAGYSINETISVLLNTQIPGNGSTILDLLPPELIQIIPQDPRFGYFYGQSGNINVPFRTIENGEHGLDELGTIKLYNGEPKLSFWNDTYCDMINGTDGAIYPPQIDINKDYYIFDKNLCRSIYATFEKEVETFGIPGKRFSVPEIVLANNTVNEDNKCYCRNKDPNRECFGAGVLDLRSCLFGAPIILSLPHFFQGDEKYKNAFVGLNPNLEEHQTFFDLEPLTAIPMEATKRIQLNIDVRNYRIGSRFLNINDTIFPVLWINESAKLDQASADDINHLFTVLDGVNIGRWCFLGAGIALVLASVIMFAVYFPRRNQDKVA